DQSAFAAHKQDRRESDSSRPNMWRMQSDRLGKRFSSPASSVHLSRVDKFVKRRRPQARQTFDPCRVEGLQLVRGKAVYSHAEAAIVRLDCRSDLIAHARVKMRAIIGERWIRRDGRRNGKIVSLVEVLRRVDNRTQIIGQNTIVSIGEDPAACYWGYIRDQASIRENPAKLGVYANIRVAKMPVLSGGQRETRRLKASSRSAYLPSQIRIVVALKRRLIQEGLDRPGGDARGKIEIPEARQLLVGNKGRNVKRIGLINKVEIIDSNDHQTRLARFKRLGIFRERNQLARGCRCEREHEAFVPDKAILVHQ